MQDERKSDISAWEVILAAVLLVFVITLTLALIGWIIYSAVAGWSQEPWHFLDAVGAAFLLVFLAVWLAFRRYSRREMPE